MATYGRLQAADDLKTPVQKTALDLTRLVLSFCSQSLHLIGLWFSEASTIHWAGTILFIAINGGCLGFFKISATAVYDGPNNIVSAGTDLSQKGLIEFLWDMLYSSWFCEVAVLLTPWLWLAMLLVRLSLSTLALQDICS